MKTPTNLPRLKGFRYPREVIAYAIWTGSVAKFLGLFSEMEM